MTDRTEEFRGAVKVFRLTVVVEANAHPPPPTSSEFLQLASSVAVGFEGTAKLIERLKKLVGRKGFSNNPAAEISDVMKLFEGDMAGLQKDIALLQRHADSKINSQRQKHRQHIVATLRHSAKEHTKAFRDALLLRAAVEKQQNDRQRIFSHSRGVAPAAQLDYPLFGAPSSGGTGLRSRAPRRPAAPPPPPFPSAAAPSNRENGRPPPPSFADGSSNSNGDRDERPSWPQTIPPTLPNPAPRRMEGGGGGVTALGSAPGPNSGSGRYNGVQASGGGLGRGVAGGATAAAAVTRGPYSAPAQFGGANGAAGGGGQGGERGVGVPLPPTEAFRAGTGAFGLRKRGGREDGGDAEEDSRRAAWQVQVQEDSKSRVEESHKVEKMIGELGQMFSRFSTMVAAQEEVVMHIEDDVEAAHAFAEDGQANLAKYYQIMSGNRGMIIKVFIMLIFFIWVFLGVMR